MRVLVKEGEAVLADLSFEDEEITIGSDSGCGIHLPDTRVSTRNAVIYPHDNGDWSIDSLDAENPILINCHKLTERFTLHHGDEITIQDFLLKIYLDQELDRHVVEDTRLTPEELARIKEFPLPAGSVLLTGTGLRIREEAALAPGDTVVVRVPEVGELSNPAALVE